MPTKSQKAEIVSASSANDIHAQEQIESLRDKYHVGRAVYAGACAINGWKPGKTLTKEEFLNGVAAFVGMPMHNA